MSFDAGKSIPVPRDILWQEGSWLVVVTTMDYLLIFFCRGILIINILGSLFSLTPIYTMKDLLAQ